MTASRACNYLQNAAATTYKKFLQFYAKRSCKKHCVVLEYSILFPALTFFLNVFHLPFGDKFIIRFKAANSVQCIG